MLRLVLCTLVKCTGVKVGVTYSRTYIGIGAGVMYIGEVHRC